MIIFYHKQLIAAFTTQPWDVMQNSSHQDLRMEGLAAAKVNPQLQRYSHVVLHASHFPAQCLPLLAKHVLGRLELHRVDSQLVLHALPVAFRILAQKWIEEGDSLISE